MPVGTGGDFAEISGVVSDFWGVIKEGGGLLVLSGDNLNTGTTTINAGTLRAANANALGRASAAVSLSGSDAILELADGIAIDRPLTIGNGGDNKTLRLHDVGSSGNYSGTIFINETAVSNFDIAASAGQVFTVSGKILGTAGGGIDKIGAGTVVLAATNNAYTTPTRILGGTLIVTTLSDATAGGGDISSPSSIGSTTNVSGNLVINGGTLRHEATNTTSTNRKFATGLGGSTIDSSSNSPAHTFNFTSDFAMGFNGETGPRSVTLTGSNTGLNIMRVDIDDDPSGNPTSLVKNGAGTWLLTGTNHYTGDTTVAAGTLHLGEEGQLRFRLGAASGENNRVSGSGTAVINGAFSIDTTDAVAAGLTTGSWLLEDFASLTGPCGPTFTVAGFDDVGENRWTLVEGTRGWTFEEGTGPSDTAPVATGLPDLTGTDWQYHTFKLDASEGLTGRGFMRLKVSQP